MKVFDLNTEIVSLKNVKESDRVSDEENLLSSLLQLQLCTFVKVFTDYYAKLFDLKEPAMPFYN